jgi:hypothetical protein
MRRQCDQLRDEASFVSRVGLLRESFPMTVPSVPDDDVPESAMESSIDPRMRSAWRSWLSALATDAEAAMAAALAYESLPPTARDAWLDALDADAADLAVPFVALYAPLLAVETDAGRRQRIEAALDARGVKVDPPGRVRAFHGIAPSGDHVCAVVSPLYLDFVELLVCRYSPDGGVVSARRDPVRHVHEVLAAGLRDATGGETCRCVVDDVTALEVPLGHVIEGLAHAVVADQRHGRSAPPALTSYAHLFGPDLQAPPQP